MRSGIHTARIQNRTGERAQFVGIAEGLAPFFSNGERVLFEADNDYVAKEAGEDVRLHKIQSVNNTGATVFFRNTFVTRTDW